MTQKFNINGTTIEITHHGKKSVVVPIPYAFVLGAVNIAGIFYLSDPLDESYSDGSFVGVVVGTYRIDKNNAEASADNGLLKVSIRIDIAARKIQGRLCTRNIFNGGWDCGGWSDILTW